jgi:hypothetical protein
LTIEVKLGVEAGGEFVAPPELPTRHQLLVDLAVDDDDAAAIFRREPLSAPRRER